MSPDIVRYIKRNQKYPSRIIKRAFEYGIYRIKAKIFKYWIIFTIKLCQMLSVPGIEIFNQEIYIRTKNNMKLRYMSHYDGGLGTIQFDTMWEKENVALFLSCIPNQAVIFDIGANIGWYSLMAAIYKKASVYAFEPSDDAFKALQSNISSNQLIHLIHAYQIALADKSGTLSFTIGDFFGNHVVNKNNLGSTSVNTTTIDHFVKKFALRKINAIKADIEGYEMPMLLGAQLTLKKMKPILFLEIQKEYTMRYHYKPEDLFAYLDMLDYHHIRITHDGKIAYPSESSNRDLEEGNMFLFYPHSFSNNIRSIVKKQL